MNTANRNFQTIIQRYFVEYLPSQRNASIRTIESYRDTFRLLLRFFAEQGGKTPSRLEVSDLCVENILAFLDDIERRRQNCCRTRNQRLSAIRAFAKYHSFIFPESLPEMRRIDAIPYKRDTMPIPVFLSLSEVQAILSAAEEATWSGRRDRVLFTTLYNTGARVSEIAAVKICDLMLTGTGFIRLHGKGRKERTVPLWKQTVRQIRHWLQEIASGKNDPLFPNSEGMHLTRSAIRKRLIAAAKKAASNCPTLKDKRISPHAFRHTTALHLLQSGVDISVIALWLGHENIETTHLYIVANLELKEKALNKLQEPNTRTRRFVPDDSLLRFLDGL